MNKFGKRVRDTPHKGSSQVQETTNVTFNNQIHQIFELDMVTKRRIKKYVKQIFPIGVHNIFLSYLRDIEIKKRKLITKQTLQRLENNNDLDTKKFSATLNFIIANNGWVYEEINAFNKVNELSNKYLASTEEVVIKDYCASYPGSERKKEQMNEFINKKITISKIHKSASSKEKWGKLIFKIIRDFKPVNCLELGTCLGISSAYQISALKLNNKGKLNTIEEQEELSQIADKNLKQFQYQNYFVHTGKFVDVLPRILTKDQPIDLVFIDGHHEKKATREYFEFLYPYLAKKSILIFDDINWSVGMQLVWQDIYNDNRIKTTFDLYNWGICFVDKDTKINGKNYFKVGI